MEQKRGLIARNDVTARSSRIWNPMLNASPATAATGTTQNPSSS
jgi:hypothetical protein